ncbi:MAG: acriflavin resistance protein [Gammaproteobacteria bacterium SG8_15]|nr:MAG: acriflavin resistance protein [Gammaproteobacteria bacterium SG8_15]
MAQQPLKLGLKQLAARTGGLAAMSIRHPVGVTMIALAVIVLGVFALGRLSIDLLPHIIYPEVRVRIIDPGVPATVMEDRITRQLEEQLAITEDAISVQSRTSQGLSTVDLSFEYGKDIDIALRDASTRLDRAKRFLPDTIDPPVIYKRDPSQIPVLEFVVTSGLRDAVELRSWTDDVLRKWFLNLPGVAAAEIGGGMVREIHVLVDQQRLAGIGLTMDDVVDALQRGNREDPAGRLQMSRQQISGRISGRFTEVSQIKQLPLRLSNGKTIYLDEVASVVDTHEDERIRVRANGISGIKMSIQKQPNANTVAVVDVVNERLVYLRAQGLLPDDIEVVPVADQSVYIRQSLSNSTLAAISGALLAMAVVYIFLGNLRRTLIIGSAIPIAIMVTFVLMGMGGLTLNVMTLGGLALGVGMLVDNTIVMLENIYRHQREDEAPSEESAVVAAKEVNSAIVASTSTNLSAVLPFLFIGGLTGLLFRELIFTISAAILASMVIALTLVPTLAAKVTTTRESRVRKLIDAGMRSMQEVYSRLLVWVLRFRWTLIVLFTAGMFYAVPTIFSGKEIFLPKLDDGQITVRIKADTGVALDEMDDSVRILENLFLSQPETDTVFTLVGGFIFGRTERESPNSSTLTVQLVPVVERDISSQAWIEKMQKLIAKQQMAGIKVRMSQRGIRGIRTSRGDDDVSLRIQGPDMLSLEKIARDLVERLKSIEGLQNLEQSLEDENFELSINIDRERASALGFDVEDLTDAMQIALEGKVITDFIEGDRSYDVRVRLPPTEAANPQDLESVLLFAGTRERAPVYLGSVANIELVKSPANITRDNQMRIVEISASLAEGATLGGIAEEIDKIVNGFPLPAGYNIYDAGSRQALQEGQQLVAILIALALFLVFVVMAVQYESLLNPFVIMLSVPFALIGVAIGVDLLSLQLSMPVKLGLIMLAGIVVNNAIVLVEYIEIVRARGIAKNEAIIQAAKIRLRPILMTTLTTVVGMLPLALGLGEGAEMLQPLAVTIVAGLSFSMIVSLVLVPAIYSLLHYKEERIAVADLPIEQPARIQ